MCVYVTIVKLAFHNPFIDMEITNQNHHEIQDQLLGSTPNTIMSQIDLGSPNTNPRDSMYQNDFFEPNWNASIIHQDLGVLWANSSRLGHDSHLPTIEGESSSDSYPRFHEMPQSSTSAIEELQLCNFIKSTEQGGHLVDLSEKLLSRNFSSACQMNEIPFSDTGDYSSCFKNETVPSERNFSEILPTINVSNLYPLSNTECSSSFVVNMQALDLFNSGRRILDYCGSYKASLSSYGLDETQESIHKPSHNLNKVPPFNSGIKEPKRPSPFLETKVPLKKSRSKSNTSCPPLKARKEKEILADLHQMVAPYGKTDMTSVLMEAFGYIKFLQDQVETLSVPYMKFSRKGSRKTTVRAGLLEDGSEEAQQDLRSRGLSLVPLSCLSYLTDRAGGV